MTLKPLTFLTLYLLTSSLVFSNDLKPWKNPEKWVLENRNIKNPNAKLSDEELKQKFETLIPKQSDRYSYNTEFELTLAEITTRKPEVWL